VAILGPLANTAILSPGVPPRPNNVAFYGLLSEVSSTCAYGGDAVRLSLDVVVIGERGPAETGDSVDLDYFVAVTGPPPDRTILAKKPFAVHIAFDERKKRAGVTDHIEEAIPLAGAKGADLQVMLGFQQSPEVVEFYKHFRGR
jgi:hypothetical protein